MNHNNIGKFKIGITLLLLCLGHCLIDFMIGIWPIFKMMAELNLAKAGMIVALAALIGEGLQLFFGSLSDKGYNKQLLFISLIIGSGSVLLVYSKDYIVLFCFYLMTCIGSGAFHPPAAAIVNQLIPSHRALLMTIFAVSGNVGLGISQLIFSKTFDYFEGSTIILGLPALALSSVILFFRFPQFRNIRSEGSFKDMFKFFKQNDLRHLYISQVANQTILWGVIFLLPNVLKSLGYSDWICLGGGHSCLILGSALMMIPGGFLADKFSPRSVLLAANLLSSIFFYMFLFTPHLSGSMILLLLLLLGASTGLLNPITVAFGNRLVPSRPGLISAFLMGMVWCVSELLGPGGMGLLSSAFSNGGPVKAMAILGLFYLVSIYSTYLLPSAASELRETNVS